MGGALELQSTPGKGTGMTLLLTMPVEARAHTAGRLRGKRGIVVTADARVAQALTHFGAGTRDHVAFHASRCAGARRDRFLRRS